MNERLEFLIGTQGLLQDLEMFCDRAEVLDRVAEFGGLKGRMLRSVLMDLMQWLYDLQAVVRQEERDYDSDIAAIAATERELDDWLHGQGNYSRQLA